MAPILVMQQAIFTPVGLTVLDVTTKGKVSVKEILKQPLHQPLLIRLPGRHPGFGDRREDRLVPRCRTSSSTRLT